ncbi:MAG: PAS domain S-box protein [Desulfobacterales bacterium]|nr:PAS domain S-box protein [Desulfobacterales bacterium]
MRKHILPLFLFSSLVIGVMVYSFSIGERMARQYGPLSDASMQIKFELSQTHLWFEEWMSGDPHVTPKDFWVHLDQAQWYAQAMLTGGQGPHGALIPLDDEMVNQDIRQTLEGIRKFRDMARQRLAHKAESGIGSLPDQSFDEIFKSVLLLANDSALQLHRGVARHIKQYRILQIVLIATILGLSLALGMVFHSIEGQRRRNLARIQEREENLRITLNSIGDGVMATDLEGRLVRMNPVAARLTGWEPEEARGRHLDEIFRIVNAHTRKPAFDPVGYVLKTGNVVGLANHTVLISKDGTEYQIADSASPIEDNEGNMFGVVLVFRDVTQDYLLQSQLAEQRAHLQRAQAVARVGHWQVKKAPMSLMLPRKPIASAVFPRVR